MSVIVRLRPTVKQVSRGYMNMHGRGLFPQFCVATSSHFAWPPTYYTYDQEIHYTADFNNLTGEVGRNAWFIPWIGPHLPEHQYKAIA